MPRETFPFHPRSKRAANVRHKRAARVHEKLRMLLRNVRVWQFENIAWQTTDGYNTSAYGNFTQNIAAKLHDDDRAA